MKAIRSLLVSFLVLCLSTTSVVADKKHDRDCVIEREFPQEVDEVLATFGAIGESITYGAGLGSGSVYMDDLISFHGYSRKFTEFNDGRLYDGKDNEQNERTLFGEVVDEGGVIKFSAIPNTLQVAVYCGNVANLTFISDFILKMGGNEVTINNLITLLFVKTKGEWKIVHEHHSPADLTP